MFMCLCVPTVVFLMFQSANNTSGIHKPINIMHLNKSGCPTVPVVGSLQMEVFFGVNKQGCDCEKSGYSTTWTQGNICCVCMILVVCVGAVILGFSGPPSVEFERK
eukprot:TRINITY_DN67059_c7_g3_i1.p1 TRINITY_DN67059_c7_g3~~TRINITY_DN67059_c7_g3_i1.p1  ORF type:complete len:106 (-),score=1.96 TRINITY_DN67059_c7_g3_i1:298-615(-)